MNLKQKTINILSLPAKEVEKMVIKKLNNKWEFSTHFETIRKKGSYLYFRRKNKPETKPTIIGHFDTINDSRNANPPLLTDILVTEHKESYFGPTKQIISLDQESTSECLGGDDRAGISTILTILEMTPLKDWPNIMFAHEEEVGCIGTKQLIKDNIEMPTQFFMEFDRRGDDVVFYNNENPDFQKIISKVYDKPIGRGSSSDVRHLSAHYKINGVNISVGFINEHTKAETINLNIIEKTAEAASKLLQDQSLINTIGSIEWKEKPKWSSTYTNYYSYDTKNTKKQENSTDKEKIEDIYKKVIDRITELIDQYKDNVREFISIEQKPSGRQALYFAITNEKEDIDIDIVVDDKRIFGIDNSISAEEGQTMSVKEIINMGSEDHRKIAIKGISVAHMIREYLKKAAEYCTTNIEFNNIMEILAEEAQNILDLAVADESQWTLDI